tara:strand:- start:4100 stop:4672 length:573 start_codon:yes stop_codon:yes gene_type:complete
MKLTQKQLLQIIKEEIDAVMNEDRHTVNFDGLVRLLKNLIMDAQFGQGADEDDYDDFVNILQIIIRDPEGVLTNTYGKVADLINLIMEAMLNMGIETKDPYYGVTLQFDDMLKFIIDAEDEDQITYDDNPIQQILVFFNSATMRLLSYLSADLKKLIQQFEPSQPDEEDPDTPDGFYTRSGPDVPDGFIS